MRGRDLLAWFRRTGALCPVLAVIGVIAIASPGAFAQTSYADDAPDRIVMRITDEVMRIVRSDKQLRSRDLIVAASVAETLIAPRFDFPRLAAGALSQAWPSASPAQQERLADEVRTMLIQTLSVTLTSITDEKIVLDRSIVRADGKEATVRCKVLSPGDEPVGLEYELVWTGADWKAYEMRIGGVSLTAMYREQFAPIIRRRGIDGLISVLEKKNSTAVRSAKAVPAAKPPISPAPEVATASQPSAAVASQTVAHVPPSSQIETARPVLSMGRAQPRPQNATQKRTTVTGPCIFKPVMTDQDIANCR